MAELKLEKLPDRTPVKHTITVVPELEEKLLLYSKLYQQVYGATETIETLIPFMLDCFLDSDREFTKARKGHNMALAKGRMKSQHKDSLEIGAATTKEK